ncbi:MAG: thioesterase family protein, partial [Alphaproteobacteria bacterium]|nr:thioesterase family protein [Alphaproteobacteria bacterium]
MSADPDQSTHFFDRETAVERVSDTEFRAEFFDTWGIAGGTPNGGYLMALATRALSEILPHPHPLTVTGHYMKRSEIGPVEVQTERLGRSLTTSTGFARLIQDGVQRTHFTATFTDFKTASGQSVVHAEPPAVEDDECRLHLVVAIRGEVIRLPHPTAASCPSHRGA